MTPSANSRGHGAPYQAASTGVAIFASSAGCARFAGADHLDFLHRLSTNDVAGLAVGAGLRTVFCDRRGRIVDLVTLCRIDTGCSLAVVGPIHGGCDRVPVLLEWLERYRFAEHVEWEDCSHALGQWHLVGPAAVVLADTVLGVDCTDLAPLAVRRAADVHIQRCDLGARPGLRLWASVGTGPGLAAGLREAGAVAGDAATLEILRVEAGGPGACELTAEHNPWELGLDDAIHLDKGCYLGQEVIARLDTYGKVKQHLVGLRLDAAVPQGAMVTAARGPVGIVTSRADSPRLGPVALAFLRTPCCDVGTTVRVEGVGATVSPLPL